MPRAAPGWRICPASRRTRWPPKPAPGHVWASRTARWPGCSAGSPPGKASAACPRTPSGASAGAPPAPNCSRKPRRCCWTTAGPTPPSPSCSATRPARCRNAWPVRRGAPNWRRSTWARCKPSSCIRTRSCWTRTPGRGPAFSSSSPATPAPSRGCRTPRPWRAGSRPSAICSPPPAMLPAASASSIRRAPCTRRSCPRCRRSRNP